MNNHGMKRDTRKIWRVGDAIPNFTARSSSGQGGGQSAGQKLYFPNVAGRYTALCFFGSASIEKNRNALQYALSRQDFFNDVRASFFGVTIDPSDEATGRVRQITPGYRFLWDDDKAISQIFGAITSEQGEKVTYSPFTLLLDHNLRVIANIPIIDAAQHNEDLAKAINNLPEMRPASSAPILLLPNIFEPDFCLQLIEAHRNNAQPDFLLDKNNELHQLIQQRVARRLLPEIAKIFNFNVTRIEKYSVNYRDSQNSGLNRYNRHNATPATEHRKFFVAINCNDDFVGGDHRFAEYSDAIYSPSAGGGIVASCNLIHEIMPISDGGKYSIIMFFYDEQATKLTK